MADMNPELKYRADPGGPGVYLFVNVTRERVTIRHIVRIERAPRGLLRPPVVVERNDELKSDTSELVACLYDEDRKIIEAFGWPAETEVFSDRDRGTPETFGGTTMRLAEWNARWRIPVAPSARYLQFYRTDFVRRPVADTKAFTRTSLGVYDLKPFGPPGPMPPLPVPDPGPSPIPAPFPNARPVGDGGPPPPPPANDATGAERLAPPPPNPPPGSPDRFPLPPPGPPLGVATRAPRPPAWAILLPGGYIKSWTTLVNNGPPSEKFNVVILGDGFTEADQDIFDHYADLVAQTLTTTLPFSTVAGRINVHKVNVVSTDSGITNCPTCGGAVKDTYFSTTGCWSGATYPGFIGTSWDWRIHEAAGAVIPQEYAHLIVTIVNCRIYGGSAPPELGMAFLTLPDNAHTDTSFVQLAAHECAHVIALLGEEYNPCNPPSTYTYRNQTTGAEVDAGTVWWQALAQPGELDGSGHLVVIHRVADPVTSSCQPVVAHPDWLGAFWGCHYGTAGSTGAICDSRGKDFYRSMARCRMRRITWEFCRVCSYLITQRIVEVSV